MQAIFARLNSAIALLSAVIYIFLLTITPLIHQKNKIIKQFNSTTIKTSALNQLPPATVTYINVHELIVRHINNQYLQHYVNDIKKSILKTFDNVNAKNYFFNAYGNIIMRRRKRQFFASNNKKTIINLPNPFLYNGQRNDNNTRLIYMKMRSYYQELKIFLSPDSYIVLNKFNYVNGNPVMYTDPSGHMRENLSLPQHNCAKTILALPIDLLHRIVADYLTLPGCARLSQTNKKINAVTQPFINELRRFIINSLVSKRLAEPSLGALTNTEFADFMVCFRKDTDKGLLPILIFIKIKPGSSTKQEHDFADKENGDLPFDEMLTEASDIYKQLLLDYNSSPNLPEESVICLTCTICSYAEFIEIYRKQICPQRGLRTLYSYPLKTSGKAQLAFLEYFFRKYGSCENANSKLERLLRKFEINCQSIKIIYLKPVSDNN